MFLRYYIFWLRVLILIMSNILRLHGFAALILMIFVFEMLWTFYVFSTKLSAKRKPPGKAGTQFWKNVSLRFKTQREAIEDKIQV